MQFRLGSIPLRIHASFLFTTLILGLNDTNPVFIALWFVAVLVSVTVHELGHALMGKAFGLVPEIDLHGMGGTTSWARGRDVSHWRSIAISFAGPLAGFIFGALVFAVYMVAKPEGLYASVAVRNLLWVNIGWGIVNLVPLLPLDGGNMTRSFLHVVTKGNGERPTRYISIVTSLGFLGLALWWRSWWTGMLGAMFLWTNIQALRSGSGAEQPAPARRAERESPRLPMAEAVDKAYAALQRESPDEAVRILRPVLADAGSSPMRATGLRVFAYALLLEGNWRELMPLLEREHRSIGAKELVNFARTAREIGHGEEADRIEAILEKMPREGFEFQA